jgi:phosphoribosyl 1,2-cyclic phosphodiesterase
MPGPGSKAKDSLAESLVERAGTAYNAARSILGYRFVRERSGDGRNVGFRVWGARGSLPRLSENQVRHGGNTLCIEVLHPGDEWVILEAGSGKIHLVFSHYHWDHVMGLPFFGPVYRKDFDISLYGLRSGEGHLREMLEVVFSPFYSPIYSPDNLLGSLTITPQQACHRIDGLDVKLFELPRIHPGGCVVVRVEGFGRCFVYASDVELRKKPVIEELIRCSEGADVLICDASFSQERFETAIGWGHSSLEAAVEAAHRAGVSRLVGIHYDPLRSDEELEADQAREQGRFWETTIELAKEGDTFWL